ncbi:MAG: DUF2339 domain-containing protein [Armatimonadetes bacterium]|nr:DUF2339 domain-containing protein [Armatimonadota bacterium]
MDDETLDEVLERLKRIEERLDRLESRPAERVAPPPVIHKPAQPQRVFRSYEQRQPRPIRTEPSTDKPAPPKEPEPAEKREDQEFVFGSKVLPRVGIVIVLLAIFYLVAMGIQQGWINFTVQFIGELAICGGLIGIGIWKLNEREDFGQVLVGGGSCGLYLSFAGAHVYKDIISAEVLVVLFVLLSLANFAFSWWRSSKSFWMIGYIGGLVAAGMPMDRSDYSSSLLLAGIIVLAATFLAAYRQWFKALAGLWLVSSIFVIVVTQQAIQADAMSAATAILILCGFSFLPIAAYALRFISNSFDEKGWFFLIAGGLTSLATLTFGKEILPVPHSVGVVLWSLSLLALGWYIRKRPHSSILVYTGIGTATVVAPMAFAAYPACLTYAALGLLTTAFVMARKQGLERIGAIFSASYVVLTITAYVIAMAAGPLETVVEMTMLGAIALGFVNVAYVAGKLEENMATAVTAAAAVFYLILTRAAYISAAAEPAYAVVLGQSVYVVVLAIVAIRAKWSGLGILGLIFGGFAAAIYWLSIANVGSDVSTGREISLLLVLTAALVLSAIGAGSDDKERQASSVVAAVIGGFVVVPAIYLMLGPEALGLADAPAVATAIATYAIVLGVLSMVVKWPGHAIVGSVAILIGTLYYWVEIVGNQGISGAGIQLFLTLLMSGAIVMSAFGAGREAVGRQIAWVGASVLGLFVLARAFFLVLTLPAVGMDEQTALVSSWAIYAIVLALVSNRPKQLALAGVSYAITLLSVAFYLNYRFEGSLQMGLGDQLIVTGLQSAALVLGSLSLGRNTDELQKAAVLTSIVGWFVFARMINVVLILPAIGMAEQAALTVSWSIYAALVLYLGFRFDFKNLRITSLVMFGVTIAKVFFVDLAKLDEIIRVLVLIVLGGLLLLAGYIYVRKRQGAPKERDAD